MRKIGFILLTVLLLIGGSGLMAVYASEQRETFVVGMECGYAPYNWTQSSPSDTSVEIDNGQYCDGYDVMIARHIADTLDKELVIRKIAWEGLILSLQTGQIDAIIAGMSPTIERQQEINFSDVYYLEEDTAFGVIVRKDSAFTEGTTVHDFAGARIAAQIGTHHIQLLAQLSDIIPLENYKDFPTMTVALQAGEIDGFISDSGTGDMINQTNPDLVYVQLDGEEGFEVTPEMAGVAVGVAKENLQLLADINRALSLLSLEDQRSMMQTAIARNEFIDAGFFGTVWTILQNNWPQFVRGTMTTLFVSITATIIGFFIALLVAITRNGRIRNAIAHVYITVFRGTPMMVQAMIIYYGTTMLIDGFRWYKMPFGNILAGIIIVSINTGAYMAETIRSGIQAIDKGQFEAAESLGLSRWQTMRHVILPQAIRNVIPAIGNEFIVNIKDTSVLNIISVTELFFVSNGIASTTYKIFQTFTITSAIYLFLTMVLTVILRNIEMRLSDSRRASSYPSSVSDAAHFGGGSQ